MKTYFCFTVIFLFLPGLQTEVYASEITDSQLAQISTDIQNCYTPVFLINAAVRAGKSGGNKSVDVIEEILKKCDELDFSSRSRNSGNQTDIARAYAMFYLAGKSVEFPQAKGIIENNFVLKRPICIALSKAKYYDLYKLMNNKVSRFLSKYPSTINNKNIAYEIASTHPGIKFILKNRYDSENKIVDEKLLDAMLNFALSIETIRSSKYLGICKKILKHNGSYLWDKPVIRAVMKIKTSDFNKYQLIKNTLKSTRNTENDKCEWNFNNPATINFSIKNISSEAYMILSLWRLNIERKKKVAETINSLSSSSFTAKAAAVDRLASDKKTISYLKKVLGSKDVNLQRFLALRLAEEANVPAQELLRVLGEVNR
ncbi:hypothetical protein KAH27_08075 [bacterium]|nr:hypothetical protein [bacterium]